MGTFQEDVPNQYRIHVGNIYQDISIYFPWNVAIFYLTYVNPGLPPPFKINGRPNFDD